MRIALITDGIYPYVLGGMQKHSYYLIKYFARLEVRVDFYHYVPEDKKEVALPFSKSELEFINEVKVDYPASKKFPGHYLYERYIYSKNVSEKLQDINSIDFIYCKGFAGWYLLRNRIKLGVKPKIGVNFHGYEMFQKWPDIGTGLKLQILKRPVKYHIKKADYLFSYGGGISDIISSLGDNSKIIEIPTGISSQWVVKETINRSETIRKFIFVGRAERRKGIKEINEVLADLKDLEFEFHFVGPIENDAKVKMDHVFYHGMITDENEIKDILEDMDVLVCPSYSEGMPNVIMEGMARGLAIIATNVGAVNAMVDDNNGWLIEGDIRKGLKNSIKYAIEINEEELVFKKNSSIEKVRNTFTWENIARQTLNNIKEVIN